MDQRKRPKSELAVLAIFLLLLVLFVIALLDAKLYQRSEVPARGPLGLPPWSVVVVMLALAAAGLCLFAWRPMRRMVIALPFVILLAGLTGYAVQASVANLGPDPCYQLNAVNVGNMRAFSEVNGIEDGSQWINVLTGGVTDPVPEDRVPIAKAVDASSQKFAQLMASLPPSLRSSVAKLGAIASSSSLSAAQGDTAAVLADAKRLTDYAFKACQDAG